MTHSPGDKPPFLVRIWHTVREHASNAVVGGAILVVTGFTPEHWIAEIVRTLHLPDIRAHVPPFIDVRLCVLTLGVMIIVGDTLWRRHRLGAPATGSVMPSVESHRPKGGATSALDALPLPDKPSIAVLPFQNLGGDPEQEYFADGMVEDIITGLSRIRWLFVVARNSTLAYKGRTADAKQISRELGIRYLLEGSVRKTADKVRVTAQLIDATTGLHIWGERYERKCDDIFALQDELTLSLVGAIEPSLLSAEADRVSRKRSDNLVAYDLVLQAQSRATLPVPESAAKALPLLQRALKLDPTYGLAHAYAAMCHHSLYLHSGLSEENRTASVYHAHQAMLLGQDDALALTLAGFSIGMDAHDRAGAVAAFEAALAISPSSALTYILGSVMFGWGGEADRAIEWGECGIRLSPFDPWRASAFIGIALGHFQRGEFERSIAAARKAVQFRPGFSISYLVLAAPLAKLGRIEEAKTVAARALEIQPGLRFNQQFAGVDCHPALAASLRELFLALGLPE